MEAMPVPSTIINLPNEILLEIFERLSLGSVERLWFTCQTFRHLTHNIIIGLYLSHLRDFVLPNGILFFTGTTVEDVFKVGDVSAPIKIASLRLVVRPDMSVLKSLKGIHALLLRVESIDTVEVTFDSITSTKVQRTPANVRWMSVLASVFRLLLLKTRTSIEVPLDGGWMRVGRPSTLRHNTPRADIVTLPRIVNTLVSAESEQLTKQGPSPLHVLQFVRFISDVPFLAPFYRSTLRSMNCTRIKSVVFEMINLLYCDWAHILHDLTLPYTTHISFGSAPIPYPDLHAFLTRHSSLETLDLSGAIPIGSLKAIPTDGNLLPNLRTLIADAEYVGHFINPPNIALPSLTSLTMTSDYGITRGHYDFTQFEPAFYHLSQRSTPSSLTLLLHSQPGFPEWLKSVGYRLGSMEKVKSVVELELRFYGTLEPETIQDLGPLSGLFVGLESLKVKYLIPMH